MRTSVELPYLAILAGFGFILIGGMLMPLATHAGCFVTKAAKAAIKPVLMQLLRYILAVATAGAALSILVAVIATPATAQTPLDKAQTAITKSIERMIGIMDKVAKNPVVQGAKVIARGYTALKVYRLSKEVTGLKTDVAALNASVHAVLTEVTGVISRIEASEALTAAELEAVNDRIDVHAVQIAAAEAEIEVLKLRMDEAERKQLESDRRQRETDARQRETETRVIVQQKKFGRDSKTPYHYFDRTCRCRRDKRDIDGGLLDVRAQR